jgi:hypothetical protein
MGGLLLMSNICDMLVVGYIIMLHSVRTMAALRHDVTALGTERAKQFCRSSRAADPVALPRPRV